LTRPIALHHQPGCGSAAEVEAARAALEAAMDALGVPPDAEVALVFSDDTELRALNLSYRGQDKPTDVLSFPGDPADLPPGEPPYLGDIVISVAQAAAGAARAGQSLADELRLLAVHGLLHLLGHEDETEEGAEAMARLEIALGVRAGEEFFEDEVGKKD
jgi:probable rRNA maturation factor